jgi:NADH dehydrogenase FAD-containing subunit
MRHQVVIIGGGFGGLACARGLAHVNADIKLVDRRNFHLFSHFYIKSQRELCRQRTSHRHFGASFVASAMPCASCRCR